MQPGRRTVAGALDVVGHRVGILCVADIAGCHRCHYAGFQHSDKEIAVKSGRSHLRIAQRQVDDVGTVLQSELNSGYQLLVAAVSCVIQYPDSHYFGAWSDACLRSGDPLSGNDAGHMGSMTVLIHGVVVVVDDIVAVVWEFGSAVPHAACNVHMVVVHARVDNGHDHTVAVVACGSVVVPHGRGVHLVNMPGVVTGAHGFGFAKIGKHFSWFVLVDIGYVATGFQLPDGLVGGLAAEGIDTPERMDLLDFVAEAGHKIQHFGL